MLTIIPNPISIHEQTLVNGEKRGERTEVHISGGENST